MALLMLLGSCGTPEFQGVLASCEATWMEKLPPQYEDRLVNRTETRRVPTGKTSCTNNGTTITCIDEMRTEYYTIVEVETVDRNVEQRGRQVRQCTQAMCTQKYGNPRCKV